VALRNSEAWLRLIIDSALDAVVTMDEHGVVTRWNPQAEMIFGWSPDEAINAKLADLIIPEAYRAAHYQGLAHFLECGEGPFLNQRLELEALHKDGLILPVELAISVLCLDDHYEFSAFVRDITERKAAEQMLREHQAQLQTIFDQTVAGIAQTDLTGRFVLANKRYCEIVGRSAKVLYSLRMQDITYPDDLPASLSVFEKAKKWGTSAQIEKRYVRSDGALVWVSNSVSALKDASGKIKQLMTVTVDITDRKHTDEALPED
jgi:PAS domain S-box-containing protein